jgi:ABC-type multidrug transport system fused ATPase/permease subunit
VVRDIKAKLYAKIQTVFRLFYPKRGGELMSRITNDVKLVENAVSYGSTDLIYQSMQVAIFAVVIFLFTLKWLCLPYYSCL